MNEERRSAHGVVLAHGAMSEGLVSAVRRIVGNAADVLTPVSNEGRGPAELTELIDGLAAEGPLIVFADLGSGSCATAALTSRGRCADRAVICGVNLPILLDFVFHRDLPLDQLVVRLVEHGQAGIRRLPIPD